MTVRDRIIEKLTSALSPMSLDVTDDSALHSGHIGHPGSGHPGTASSTETHFSIKVVAQEFAGKRLLHRHRKINEILAEELSGGVHALAIEARAPEE